MLDLKKYWENRVRPTRENRLSSLEQVFIYMNTAFCNKLLDFGCGNGRNFYMFKDIPIVHGHDIIKSRENKASFQAKKHLQEFKFIADVNKLDNDYDCIVCSELLLHVPNEQIQAIIDLFERIAKKVIIITYDYDINNKIAEHCFYHNYKELFDKYNASYFYNGKRLLIDYDCSRDSDNTK